MSLEQLRQHLVAVEKDQEAAKAAFFRTEGAILVLKQLIELEDKPPVEPVEGTPD